jgi:hypothetical protein
LDGRLFPRVCVGSGALAAHRGPYGCRGGEAAGGSERAVKPFPVNDVDRSECRA